MYRIEGVILYMHACMLYSMPSQSSSPSELDSYTIIVRGGLAYSLVEIIEGDALSLQQLSLV